MIIASAVVDFHSNFARVALIYSAIVGAWGLFLYLRGSNPTPGYLGSVAIAEGVMIFQGLVGLFVRVHEGHGPKDNLHFLYGLVLVLAIPTAYFMSAHGTERRDSLLFGLAGVFLVGVAIRGITTGAG